MPVRLTRDELRQMLPDVVDVAGRVLTPVDAGHVVGIVRKHRSVIVSRSPDGDPAGAYVVRYRGFTTVPGVVVAVIA